MWGYSAVEARLRYTAHTIPNYATPSDTITISEISSQWDSVVRVHDGWKESLRVEPRRRAAPSAQNDLVSSNEKKDFSSVGDEKKISDNSAESSSAPRLVEGDSSIRRSKP